MIRRRDLGALLGGAAAWPLGAHAQAAAPVIGILSGATQESGSSQLMGGLRRGLGELGFVEGRTVAIDARWSGGQVDLLPSMAADLVHRAVSVILCNGGERAVRAAMAATATIPIVAIVAGDPVKRGLVASVNRPGGHLTVVSLFTFSSNALVAKRVQILHEMVPTAGTIGWLTDSTILDYEDQLSDLQRAAQLLGLDTVVERAARDDALETALASLVHQGAGAILTSGPVITDNPGHLAALAARAAIPVMYEWPISVAEGGLTSYGTDYNEVSRQAGLYVARILKGEKAGDLPVQQPTKIELVINLKTAKALGIAISPSLLVRADKVIE